MSTTHTLSVLVEDRPGVLARVSSLFSRRGFNIESLAVGGTELKGVSRMTIVVTVDELPLEQVTKQLNKLVNVIKIVELEPAASVQREHMLIKVRADNQTRSNVIEVVNLFRASVVDYATDALVVEVTGDRGKVDALLRALKVEGDFAPDDIVYLAGTDLEQLAERLDAAPVEGRFEPAHAVIIASHLQVGEPEIPASLTAPLTPEEYTSLVVHAAVDAENS